MLQRYVNLGSTAGGDGTTNNTTGADRAFASLHEALDALTGTLTEAVKITCTKGSGGTDGAVGQAEFDFYTTAANYLVIEAAAGDRACIPHDTSRYTVAVTNDNGIYNNYPEHLRIDGIQVQITVTNGSSYIGIKTTNANQTAANIDCRVTNCVVKAVQTSGTVTGFETRPPGGAGAGASVVKNCLAYNCNYGFGGDWATSEYYNCTAADCTYGFVADAAWTAINCLASGSTVGFVGTFSGSSDYNAEDDGNGAPGAHSHSGHTFTFVNEPGDDFHLDVDDVGAMGLGIGPGSDADVPSTDIDGDARAGVTCDIGADEYDPGPAVLTQAQFRFFGTGDELPHYEPPVIPVIEAGDVVSNGNNTAETTPNISYPAHSLGDLIIQVLLSDADAAHTNPGATGPNGETINTICFNQETGGTNGPHFSVVYWVASANTIAGDQIWLIASEQWVGMTIVVPAAEFYATTPIGTIGTLGYNDSDAGTADMPAFTPNRSGGRVVCVGGADTDPMAADYDPVGWTGLRTQDIGAVSCFCAVRDALSVASEEVALAAFDISGADSYCCIGFMVNGTVAVADGRTPSAAAGADVELEVNTDYGVSVRVENSGGATTEDTYKWQYKKNSGSWTDITSSSSVVKAAATADFLNGADVQEYIGGSGTYVTNNNAGLDTTGTLVLAAVLGLEGAFESHLNFQIVSGDVADNDIIYLRIVYEDGTAFDSYGTADTNIPAITVNKAGEEHSGSAAITGGGSLVAVGQKGGKGAATVSALGSIVALGVAAMFGLAAISGGGAVTALGQKGASNIASISGGGSLVGTGTKQGAGSAEVSGGGSLVAEGYRSEGESHSGAAVITGGGSLAAGGSKGGQGSASTSGNGTLAAVGSKSVSGISTISGGGSIIAAGTKTAQASSVISGGGAIAGQGQKATAGSGAISAGGVVAGIGSKQGSGSAAISGGGAITAEGHQVVAEEHAGAASISGGGEIKAYGVKGEWITDRVISIPLPRTVTVGGENTAVYAATRRAFNINGRR